MRKTFDESQVLFRYPDDNPIPRYVIVKDDSASSKIRVYCLSVGSYREASTGEYKALIAILLTEREEMSKWKTDALQWFEEAAELARKLKCEKIDRQKAEAERDVFRAALSEIRLLGEHGPVGTPSNVTDFLDMQTTLIAIYNRSRAALALR